MPPGCVPDIAANRDPFMECRTQQVEAAELAHDAVAYRYVARLGLERAEKPVPERNDVCQVLTIGFGRIRMEL